MALCDIRWCLDGWWKVCGVARGAHVINRSSRLGGRATRKEARGLLSWYRKAVCCYCLSSIYKTKSKISRKTHWHDLIVFLRRFDIVRFQHSLLLFSARPCRLRFQPSPRKKSQAQRQNSPFYVGEHEGGSKGSTSLQR